MGDREEEKEKEKEGIGKEGERDSAEVGGPADGCVLSACGQVLVTPLEVFPIVKACHVEENCHSEDDTE